VAVLSPLLKSTTRASSGELDKLAGEIGWYEDQARKTVLLALQYKLEIGRRLARAKTLLPHGKFLAWAQHEFGWTPRHVQRHLTLAENGLHVSGLPAGTSLRMALAAIRELRIDTGKVDGKQGQDPTKFYIIGEIKEGSIDRDRLLLGVTCLAKELGAENVRWRIRSS
jgi:hypothetical protein